MGFSFAARKPWYDSSASGVPCTVEYTRRIVHERLEMASALGAPYAPPSRASLTHPPATRVNCVCSAIIQQFVLHVGEPRVWE